jgi:hypothetical protein
VKDRELVKGRRDPVLVEDNFLLGVVGTTDEWSRFDVGEPEGDLFLLLQ